MTDGEEGMVKMVTERMERGFEANGIPDYMRDGIAAHVLHGRMTGDFLSALFRCDFMEIAVLADDNNIHLLREYAVFLWNNVPIDCKGSAEKVVAWRKRGGFIGIFDDAERNAKSKDEPIDEGNG